MWHQSESQGARKKSNSLVGTAVNVLSLDGVATKGSMSGILLEISENGVLIRTDSGELLFSTSCAVILRPDSEEI